MTCLGRDSDLHQNDVSFARMTCLGRDSDLRQNDVSFARMTLLGRDSDLRQSDEDWQKVRHPELGSGSFATVVERSRNK